MNSWDWTTQEAQFRLHEAVANDTLFCYVSGNNLFTGKKENNTNTLFVIRRNSMPWPRNVHSLLLNRRKRNEGPHGTTQSYGYSVFFFGRSFWLIGNPCIRDSSINYLSVAFFSLSVVGIFFFFLRVELLFSYIPCVEFRAVARITRFWIEQRCVRLHLFELPFCNICIMKSH